MRDGPSIRAVAELVLAVVLAFRFLAGVGWRRFRTWEAWGLNPFYSPSLHLRRLLAEADEELVEALTAGGRGDRRVR